MTPKQKLIVQSTFEQIQPNLLVVTSRFYHRLFRKHEHLKVLFEKSHEKQVRDFSDALAEIVHRLDNPPELSLYLRTLARRHRGFDLSEEHYAEVGKAFVFALRHALGVNFKRNIADAWNRFFQEIGKLISDGRS